MFGIDGEYLFLFSDQISRSDKCKMHKYFEFGIWNFEFHIISRQMMILRNKFIMRTEFTISMASLNSSQTKLQNS